MTPYEDGVVSKEDLTNFVDFDDHEVVVRCHDEASGLRAIVAIHDTSLGPGMGGCRMKPYATEADAMKDALRLSRGMTFKYAAAGLNYGGAQAVIIDDGKPKDREAKIVAFARFVERLNGLYATAEDAGIETADVRLMSRFTRHIRNLPLGDTGDGALCTAWGVFHGIEAALQFRAVAGLNGLTVAVEGIGKVGMTLCLLLHSAGAALIVYDVDDGRIAEAVARFGAKVAQAGQIHTAQADVYSPCALGAVLGADTVPGIKASIVAGAANNQLADPS